MNTGLVTFYHIHHYGAVLQAAATQRAVEALGSACQIVDYYVNQNNDLFRRSMGLGALAANGHTALHYGALKTRWQRFEDFAHDHLRITSHRYESLDELRRADLPYDVILAGSDQIWNPVIFPDKRFDPVFFGAFSHKRKIAYAPSFGVPKIPAGMEDELRGYLSEFSHLSVRETGGRDIVRDVTGQTVPVVLDPTLLLDREQWGAMARPSRPKDSYILCYCINPPGVLAPYIRALAERTGLPVVQLCGIRRKVHPQAQCVLDAGPAEFLGLFQNAAYVCTNSFHGTVFSTQFQRPFFTAVAPSELSNPERSRTFSLLSRLGLTGRIVGKGDKVGLDDPVDWPGVEQRLTQARKSSMDYLKAALAGEGCQQAPEEMTVSGPVLASRADCTGCSACAAVCPVGAIQMKPDGEGFLRPVVADSCVLCHCCEQTCPILHENKPSAAPDKVYAVWNRDEDERAASSSGGVFSLLARRTLERDGAVFGAVVGEDMTVRHVCARTVEELAPMRGSKYVQSDLGDTFQQAKDLLDQNIPVLFSGVPCQIDGLRRYLDRDYDGLVTCDLVCHGVPSPAVFGAYLSRLERTQGSQTVEVRFKDKSHGWRTPYFTVRFADGGVFTQEFNRTGFGRGFGMQLFLRPSCARCRYADAARRPADLTLADYWGLDPAVELGTDRDKGVSMVMANTEKGRCILEELSSKLGRTERPLAEAVTGNPRLASPLKANPRREEFFAAFALEPFAQVEKDFLAQPSLPYRAAAKALSPEMKAKIRKFIK